MKFDYGGFKADPDKIYRVSGSANGALRNLDIFHGFWDEWKRAKVVFIDFPYDDRMIKHYYEQIDMTTDKTFIDLKNRAMEAIKFISPERVFVEIGLKNVQPVIDGLNAIGYATRVHDVAYAKKYPCYIVEGHIGQGFITYPIHGMDELLSIDEICKHESGPICDFFNGQGGVSTAAYKNGMGFVCSELNPNRLGKALHRLERAGAKFQKE